MAAATRSRTVRLCALVGLLAASLAACAADSHQVLHASATLPILNQPPPGGVELGRAQDQGTFAGDQAGIAVVYASNRAPAELASYYLTHYPAYSLTHDNSVDYGSTLPADSYAYIGSFSTRDVEATVVLRIRVNSPDLTEQTNYHLTPKRAPAGARTFVTVNVIGIVQPKHTTTS